MTALLGTRVPVLATTADRPQKPVTRTSVLSPWFVAEITRPRLSRGPHDSATLRPCLPKVD